MEQNAFIKDFSKKLINNDVCLFLGAGFSQNSNLPSWQILIMPCATDLNLSLSEKSDFAQIALISVQHAADLIHKRLEICPERVIY